MQQYFVELERIWGVHKATFYLTSISPISNESSHTDGEWGKSDIEKNNVVWFLEFLSFNKN